MEANMNIKIKGSMTESKTFNVSWNSDDGSEICVQIGNDPNHLYVNLYEVKAAIDSIMLLQNKN